MEDEYQIPGGDWINETGDEKQHAVPGSEFFDSQASSGPPPTPADRRRPVIIACGG